MIRTKLMTILFLSFSTPVSAETFTIKQIKWTCTLNDPSSQSNTEKMNMLCGGIMYGIILAGTENCSTLLLLKQDSPYYKIHDIILSDAYDLDGFSIPRLTKVFVDYANSHPKQLNENLDVFLQYLPSKFPCKY